MSKRQKTIHKSKSARPLPTKPVKVLLELTDVKRRFCELDFDYKYGPPGNRYAYAKQIHDFILSDIERCSCLYAWFLKMRIGYVLYRLNYTLEAFGCQCESTYGEFLQPLISLKDALSSLKDALPYNGWSIDDLEENCKERVITWCQAWWRGCALRNALRKANSSSVADT